MLQYFEHVEEAVWAVEVLKATGKPVAACLCIGPQGDMHGVSAADCAVRLVKAGGCNLSSTPLSSKTVPVTPKPNVVLQVPRLLESTATLTP